MLKQCLFRSFSVSSRCNTPLNKMLKVVQGELESITQAGTWKHERIITSKQGPYIYVGDSKDKIINFCANNYLGLSSHPDVIDAGKHALDEYGAGLSSVRFICGTQSIHKELEDKLSEFHGREDTILYASCFDANAGIFECLLTEKDAVLSDALNHASIIDGIRLCKATKFRYNHLNMADLESKLIDAQNCRHRLIVSDGVFSMDGSVTPVKEICDLADKYNAIVMLDECHATGFLGKTGRGTEQFLGINNRVVLINSTLGKALGGAAGGYTTGPQEFIDLLRNRSRPYLFSNSLPPAVVGCATQAVDMLMNGSDLIEDIQLKTERFRSKMKSARFTISGDMHPIAPIMLGDAKLAVDMADYLLTKGIYVIGFCYPVVPMGKSRIRVQISAAHTIDDIDYAVDAFVQAGKKYDVI